MATSQNEIKWRRKLKLNFNPHFFSPAISPMHWQEKKPKYEAEVILTQIVKSNKTQSKPK